ncbi:DUF427 domain-containing protein [Fodinicola acaciae]|uniref:DUF427 domain-containing protein n=1 Tax=Fodinicola acaciae TaxID=2681555 RepID=UPI0013D48A91|nr:DUF427 domain-containing protein [Fodinicola acaciae]
MDYPRAIVKTDHVEPSPRRIRGFLANHTVFDTTSAVYVWEWPPYPQYYVPLTDIADGVLVDEGTTETTSRGTARLHGIKVGDTVRPGSARVFGDGALKNLVRFDWRALDSWFEEDEEIFVHPRSPYARVDAVRSLRTVRVELDGVLLAESSGSVMVFETGLPTRYYLPRTDVRFDHLVPSRTVTECPYKGRTTGYWSVRTAQTVHDDLAWSYDFPTRQLLPIAGLIAFYNEKIDISIDGGPLPRPRTHFG